MCNRNKRYKLNCRYEHLAKSAPTILDDSLSADSYLNVLHMPSTFPRSERSRWSLEPGNDNSPYGVDFDDGPRSNLDSIRYMECVNYMQDVSQILHICFKSSIILGTRIAVTSHSDIFFHNCMHNISESSKFHSFISH